MQTNNKIPVIPYGNISVASLIITCITGGILAVNYDVSVPYLSVSKILLLNPGANIIRNLHYWSAQLFLVSFIMHIYDHIKKGNENEVKRGVWIRLTFSILSVLYVMLSGFILKGDTESQQAYRVLNSLLTLFPFAGHYLAYFLTGTEKNLQILYAQHIALGTIFLFIVTFEHSRKIWPDYKTLSLTGLFVFAAGVIFNAPLHDNNSLLIRGPWYFAGLQELLKLIPNPSYVLIIILIPPILLGILPFLNNNKDKKQFIAQYLKRLLFAISIGYLMLTLFAFFFIGENDEVKLPWNIENLTGIKFNTGFIPDTLSGKQVSEVLGRQEGCIYCHDEVNGISLSHNVKSIGCQSCHSGNPFTLTKESAHSGMYLIPGNLSNSDRTCGSVNCHPDIASRVKRSLMNTMSGVVSVDKYVFGESDSPSILSDIKKIKHSPSEKHLRSLCASCHLGNEKNEIGKINELSRGGGCLACHLVYSDSSYQEIQKNDRKIHKFHPDLSLEITNNHCFGCHSRSGRISTNYEGWFETSLKPEDIQGKNGYRVVMDERVFEKYTADVHFSKGMTCVDCHLSYELMGDGLDHFHEEDAVRINCTDCHPKDSFNLVGVENIDVETAKILALKNYNFKSGKFLVTSDGQKIISNTYFNNLKNEPELISKNSNTILSLKKTLSICKNGNSHKRLSCNSCHTNVVSNCVSCHTKYEDNLKGYDLLENKSISWSWNELPGDFLTDSPALGMRYTINSNGDTSFSVETFIPGMVINIENGSNKIFKRLFAPVKAHNTVREARSCKSCHNNSSALGYGRGKLIFSINNHIGKWRFLPLMNSLNEDGLPADAWIGFLSNRGNETTTRLNARPFTINEQIKILTAGACLTCHAENSRVMIESLNDFDAVKKKMTGNCIYPVFN